MGPGSPAVTGSARSGSSSRPSSVGEVEVYARSIGSSVPAREWWDYCVENGWKIRGEPIVDWKAAFRSCQNWGRWGKRNASRPEDLQPSAERIRENGDWLDEFLRRQDEQEREENSGEDGE